MEDITAAEFRELRRVQPDVVLVDVREEWEFEESNLSGILIPLGELRDRLDELAQYKDREIVVHCRSGKRSATAKSYMEAQGYTKVRNLLGGILAYEALS